MILSTLGKVLLIEALLLIFPMLVGVIYNDGTFTSFLIPVIALIVLGTPLSLIRTKYKSIYAKEGFIIVAVAWVILSLIGAIPFVISGQIPNYIDAVFETVSGFTTTGASILDSDDLMGLTKGMMFWRIFTHWIGGMGVLVFVLAIMPGNTSGAMHVFRAESPGPTVGKLVSKLRFTARILYGIYFVMTVVEMIFLLCGGNSFYDSVLLSFTTAGTGGFGIEVDSATSYTSYTQMVIAIFMFLFAINFNVYYLLLVGSVGKAFRSEELRNFVIIVVFATITISINIFVSMREIYSTFGSALKHSFFQVASLSSTTGLSTTDFDKWPSYSQAILLFLTIMGACGGSTGGGIKVSRISILIKSAFSDLKRLINPRSVVCTKFEGEVVERETERNVRTHFILWILVVIVCVVLLSIDSYGDLFSDFTATLACIGNVGPGLGAVGPMCSYSEYSYFSKILLSFVMLVGRLEIFPMLILFVPRTWKRG